MYTCCYTTGSYCYDCHYDPDEDKVRSGDTWGPFAGYSKCAMADSAQRGTVDRWECQTGKCFIRKDPNGRECWSLSSRHVLHVHAQACTLVLDMPPMY